VVSVDRFIAQCDVCKKQVFLLFFKNYLEIYQFCKSITAAFLELAVAGFATVELGFSQFNLTHVRTT